MEKGDLKKFTVKELKHEVVKVKKGFQVSRLRRDDVVAVILKHKDLFMYLLNDENQEDLAMNPDANVAANKDPTIVYFGAGWDFKTINNPYYEKINHFIFIDALPKLQHYDKYQPGYEKSKDKEAFINTLKKYSSQAGYKTKEIKGDYLRFEKGERVIEYYMNKTVEDALTDKEIRNKMNKSVWTHNKGFNPFEHGLKRGYSPNIVDNRGELKNL